ncbi:MAG TPA: class I SAM-dependent methyltransferase [Candidatus Kapabacteria bacterium]|nr:class I SAM-dependent methyltransferase [Candidatus Kapabacteria bacterium]HOM04642.1 class I SAM-dependent methyltransferase [Candidatus Kapabacteria bacterium]HPP39351.1 class I SAM-dependent methyltransferase [Candidatus Kapabacteria bacterium]
MQDQKDIINCYDKTAENYAKKFFNEFEGKHLDRILLKAFALQCKERGKVIDFGCGPGHTTKFLFDNGIQSILGTDISTEMVKVASRLNPNILFEQADLLKLQYADNSFNAAIAFYAIVHFNYEQMQQAFSEIKRVLKNNADFLFSFHIGTEIIKVEQFLDENVNIDFYFFEPQKIIKQLNNLNFEIIDVIERHPYKNVEYESKRCYIWTKIKK